MEKEKITYRFADIGRWMARCNHATNEIEINRREFFRLSPMLQEYIWIHEHVHLLCDVYDESECNRISNKIFISRAKNEEDRLERIKFVARSTDDPDKSNWIAAVICTVISISVSLTQVAVAKRNSGYYSLSEEARKRLVDTCLKNAFEQSLLTDTESAQDLFWAEIGPTIARKKEQTFAGWYAKNRFIDEYIEKYENQYGFGFGQVLPANPTAHPQYQKIIHVLSIGAIALAIVILVLVLYKTKK